MWHESTMPPRLFTIGHSTHPLARYVALLTQHYIAVFTDIRRFPGSPKYPQFNRVDLATSLPEAGIGFHWFLALGRRRGKATDDSFTHLSIRSMSFWNYTDYYHSVRVIVSNRPRTSRERPSARNYSRVTSC